MRPDYSSRADPAKLLKRSVSISPNKPEEACRIEAGHHQPVPAQNMQPTGPKPTINEQMSFSRLSSFSRKTCASMGVEPFKFYVLTEIESDLFVLIYRCDDFFVLSLIRSGRAADLQSKSGRIGPFILEPTRSANF
jgi:hypothetical protein